MSNRNVNVDAKYMQAQRLYATNQHEQALDELCDYFAKPKIKVWDPTLDGMAQLALELSAELSRPVVNVIKRYTSYSIDYALDTLPATIEKYIDNCYSHIEDENNRAKKEQQSCNSPLLKLVDLPRLLYNSIVRPAVEFMYNVFVTVLTELRDKSRRYDKLYHEILKRAFRFSVQFNNSEYHKYFSTELFNYISTNESKKEKYVHFIESLYVRYETAVDINNLDAAIYALGDATRLITKDKNISPLVVQKIRKAKYDLLKKNGFKLYAAIIHSNLLELYKQNKSLTPEMPLDKLHEIALIEALTSPLVQESYNNALKNKPERFLDVVGDTIPSRESLIKHLLEQPVTPALSDFVNSTEFGTDPYVICEKFHNFQEAFNQHEYYADFKNDLENYAALRAIERSCVHYTKIHIDELTEMIPWMDAERIEEIIVQASRDSIIPGHINQQGNYVELVPRGEQCLQPRLSNLNDKLRDIYDHFQRIKKVLPANLASRVISSSEAESSSPSTSQKEGRIYDSKDKIEARIKLIKERHDQAKRDKQKRESEIRARLEERQRQIEEQERKHREIEMKNKAERDKNEQDYNFAYTEIKILAHRNDINLDEFLNAPPQEGEPEHTGNSKSEDLEWIKYKAEQIKEIHIENKRSQSSIIAEKMNKIKLDRGRERVRQRLAFKMFVEGGENYSKESVLIQKIMERQAKNRKKAYDADVAAYENLKAQCEKAEPSFQSLVYEVNQKYEENRAKDQPQTPQIGLSFQINTNKQPDLPSTAQSQPPAKSTSENATSQTKVEDKEDQKETETKEQVPEKKAYKPPTSPAYKPATTIPQQSNSQQPQKSQNTQAYKPPQTTQQPQNKPYRPPGSNSNTNTNTNPGGSSSPYKPQQGGGFNLGALQQNRRDRGDRDRDGGYNRGNRGRGNRGGRGGGGRGGYSSGNQDLASKYGSAKPK